MALSSNETGGSKQPYMEINPTSSAVGKYQVLWSAHKDNIKNMGLIPTPLTSEDITYFDNHPQFKSYSTEERTYIKGFLNSPKAQEDYANKMMQKAESDAERIKSSTNAVTDIKVLTALTYRLGSADAQSYTEALIKTKDYNKAEQVVRQNIKKRTGNDPGYLGIQTYLNDFITNYNRL